jgi:hypothetical protein
VRGHYDRGDRRVVENDLQVTDRFHTGIERRYRAEDPVVAVANVVKVGLSDRGIVANVVLPPAARPDDGNPHCFFSIHAAPRFIQPA